METSSSNLTLPARLIHAIAEAKTDPKKKKDKVKKESGDNVKAKQEVDAYARPKRKRLSKVLAAAGGKSLYNTLPWRRGGVSEALIFEGKVTVNGSVCNAPQDKMKSRSYLKPRPPLFTAGTLESCHKLSEGTGPFKVVHCAPDSVELLLQHPDRP
ncbi:hypothetical protein NC653_020156 [Populus alba x Populus x berolinensis]|uniref:RNA-binding S4 domain-containing protein n=1 Tax=Populus alba x Populus x berolinensis TaxID=444605 RepID=A0AAD6MJM8_9ROSI|nr:hypothetical protein NC653_020156 [Populus alba x Populus x berolinensis]